MSVTGCCYTRETGRYTWGSGDRWHLLCSVTSILSSPHYLHTVVVFSLVSCQPKGWSCISHHWLVRDGECPRKLTAEGGEGLFWVGVDAGQIFPCQVTKQGTNCPDDKVTTTRSLPDNLRAKQAEAAGGERTQAILVLLMLINCRLREDLLYQRSSAGFPASSPKLSLTAIHRKSHWYLFQLWASTLRSNLPEEVTDTVQSFSRDAVMRVNDGCAQMF